MIKKGGQRCLRNIVPQTTSQSAMAMAAEAIAPYDASAFVIASAFNFAAAIAACLTGP
jgi:hypothetical protein